jgi:hypothetical protein
MKTATISASSLQIGIKALVLESEFLPNRAQVNTLELRVRSENSFLFPQPRNCVVFLIGDDAQAGEGFFSGVSLPTPMGISASAWSDEYET